MERVGEGMERVGRKGNKTKIFLFSSAQAREGRTEEGKVEAPAGTHMSSLTLFRTWAQGDHCYWF